MRSLKHYRATIEEIKENQLLEERNARQFRWIVLLLLTGFYIFGRTYLV